MAQSTAMIVDDQKDIRDLIRQFIDLSDYDVRIIAEAADGEGCLQIMEDDGMESPQVIVLDWMMPGLNGIETAERIRHGCPGARIILCSAFADPDLESEALAAGVDYFLHKERLSDIPMVIAAVAQHLPLAYDVIP